MKKALFLLSIFIGVQALAWYEPAKINTDRTKSKGKTEITDEPAEFWWVFFTGVGHLTDWVVSNTVQGGIFCRPPNEGPFDATFDQWMRVYNCPSTYAYGLTGEYPRGSGQFYTWGAGPWIGAERRFPGDPTWHKVVSKGAYYSDLGAMYIPELQSAGEVGDIGTRGLAFSTQIIPYNYGYAHEGELVFKQPGYTLEDHQALWPFADTLINKRREDTETHVYPDSGDIISQEDTYACAGDWIPEKDATCIWIRDAGKYDVYGLGIRIEQRTYSWNYDYNNSYIYMNWKIRNMTDDTLRNLYVGYFMDNDIGQSTGANQGAYDDLIGYDRSYVEELGRHLDLGYTYDSDGWEEGWSTPAGYIGCVMCETPADADTGKEPRMRGFQYWQNMGPLGEVIDDDMQDSVKYMVLGCKDPERDSFMIASAAYDMRQLSCSGPRAYLLPEEEVDFTIAITAAYTLDELREHAISALKQFKLGYLGYAPPPSPTLSVIPGDGTVYLSWDTSPENYFDKMAKEHTFEGYKVYRSLTGLADTSEWDNLATYDLKSRTEDTVLVKYTLGTTKAGISFEGLDDSPVGDSLFATNRYRITFLTSSLFMIRDSVEDKKYAYNDSAKVNGSGGYCIMNSIGDTAYPNDPGYVSGTFIWIDGFYVKIQNGLTDPDEPGVILAPVPGDEFTIHSFNSEPIGTETQLEHCYIDRDVVNGKKYYYSVTSFSKPLPEQGVGSLESGLSGQAYWAIPMELPANYEGASCDYRRIGGVGDIRFEAKVADPTAVTGDKYKISFIGEDPLKPLEVDYWDLVNIDRNDTLIPACTLFYLESLPIIDGIDIKLATVTRASVDTGTIIDSKTTGWTKGTSNWILHGMEGTIQSNNSKWEPYYDYELVISDTGSIDMEGKHVPFTLWNVDLDERAIYWHSGKPDTLSDGDVIHIYKDSSDYPLNWYLKLPIYDPHVYNTNIPYKPPEVGDVYRLEILNRITTEEKFEISTVKFNKKKDKYSLDNIRVVPNPYFIRAVWDKSKYDRKIWFQGLPSKCIIRIFNIAGLLVKTIEHDEASVAPMKDRTEMSGPGARAWDFVSNEKMSVASGLYIYQVETPDGKRKIGKFAIVK